jgi:hypothetical protein
MIEMIEENNRRSKFIRGSFGLPPLRGDRMRDTSVHSADSRSELAKICYDVHGIPSPLYHKYFLMAGHPFKELT